MNWNWFAAFVVWLACAGIIGIAWHIYLTDGEDDEP